MRKDIFILPGLYNSGPEHWQSKWESMYGFQRILQDNWETPDRDEWIQRIREQIAQAPGCVLIGHSLGCCTIAHLASCTDLIIGAAMLVAPSDVEASTYPPGTAGFAPMPMNKFAFPSVVVASSDDEYVTLDRARSFAAAWGSRFVEVGAYGHINGLSGLGEWPQGIVILKQLINSSDADTT